MFISVTKKDACVKHVNLAEVEKTLQLTGFSSLLRQSTEKLRAKKKEGEVKKRKQALLVLLVVLKEIFFFFFFTVNRFALPFF